jgi:gamma-glutamylcyclotransferase (GGCT)/AIG2-like uncharacterized protein YtfP
MIRYLFAYGTLLPHEAPSELTDIVVKLRKIGVGCTRGRLYDFGEYPGAVVGHSSGEPITGMVYELPPNSSVLHELDAYEGFDKFHPESGLFIRKKRLITLRNGANFCHGSTNIMAIPRLESWFRADAMFEASREDPFGWPNTNL